MRVTPLLVVCALCSGASATTAGTTTARTNVRVNCDKGDSMALALSKLNKAGPNVLSISGTCYENVSLRNYDDLQIVGTPGATLQAAASGAEALRIVASRSVTVEGLTIRGFDRSSRNAVTLSACADCVVRNCLIERASLGIWIGEQSSATLSGSTLGNEISCCGIGVGASTVNILETTVDSGGQAPDFWFTPWAGLFVRDYGIVVVADSVFRNFGWGVTAYEGGRITVGLPGGAETTVTVEKNGGEGVTVGDGAAFTVGPNGHLRVANNGWGSGGGISVAHGSFSGGNIELVANKGFGIRLGQHSVASLGAGLISGTQGPALDVQAVSLLNGPAYGAGTLVLSENDGDIYCDSTSLVTNAINITGVTPEKTACSNMR